MQEGLVQTDRRGNANPRQGTITSVVILCTFMQKYVHSSSVDVTALQIDLRLQFSISCSTSFVLN